MKSGFFLLMTTAIMLGTLQHLYAQDGKTSPGYIVAEQDVISRDALQRFGACVGPTLAPFKAKVLVRGGKTNVVEGDPPKRIIIFQFESVAVAQNWLNSEAHKACEPLQKEAIRERVYIVEGLAQ